MSQIRALTADDIPAVSDLLVRFLRRSADRSSAAARTFLARVLLENPWCDRSIPSLVYEAGDGTIAGFLGVVPRPMSLEGRSITAAVGCSLVVDPDGDGAFIGVQLLRKFFSGPQDLSLADSVNDPARRLFESLGGETSLLYSLRWSRLLRPVLDRVDRRLARRGRGAQDGFLSSACRRSYRLFDAVTSSFFPGARHRGAAAPLAEDLDARTLLLLLSDHTDGYLLVPRYDARSLDWVLSVLEQQKWLGECQRVLLRDAGQGIIGWYLYYLETSGTARVLQLGTRPGTAGDVLDHLFDDARRRGAIRVHGRVDPKLIRELSIKGCAFHAGPPWVVVHSEDREILHVIHRGDGFLSRLEVEFWRAPYEGAASRRPPAERHA